MRNRYLVLAILPFLLLAGAILPGRAQAYQPGAHYALIMNVQKNLPAGNPFKKAIATYPNYAAWGSVGPDLSMICPGFILDRTPWFEQTHYQQNGEYARYLLTKAMAEPDADKRLKLEAFAAGWSSHVIGDMAIHGLLVNPECGICFSGTEKERTRHHLLEGYADIYTWVHLADNGRGYPEDWMSPYIEGDNNKNKLYTHFTTGLAFEPNQLIEQANQEVILRERYTFLRNEPHSAADMTLSEEAFRLVLMGEEGMSGLAGLVRDEAKMYRDLDQSEARLAEYGHTRDWSRLLKVTREQRVIKAWRQANAFTLEALGEAAAQLWTGPVWKSSDAWIPDAGINDGRGIGSLQVVLETGDKDYSWTDWGGTDCTIWLKLDFEQGEKKDSYRYLCDWSPLAPTAYNDFEEGDRDIYYFPYDGPFPIWTLKKLTLEMYADPWAAANGPVWDFKQLEVRANNRVVYRSDGVDHLTTYDKEFRVVGWPSVVPNYTIWPAFQAGVMPTEPAPAFSMPDPLISIASRDVTVRKGSTARLPFVVLNATTKCGPARATITISRRGSVVKTVKLSRVTTNKARSVSFRVSLARGTYTWTVKAVGAGGKVSKSSPRELRVR